VILSHQRAEQAVAQHAEKLTCDLGDTAAELADVFSKLKGSLQVTSSDRDALKVRQQQAILWQPRAPTRALPVRHSCAWEGFQQPWGRSVRRISPHWFQAAAASAKCMSHVQV
jgi:hypothetical protein